MPICRYQIRSAHALADPELHRAADKDDSEALLEAVAMAGLVGFLRQLGDLAQFAAEIFHDLHEEVMATAARGHSLMSRVQQLEAEIPGLEKAFLSQTHHSTFFTNGGIEWHPNLQSEQNLVTHGDLPRFIMDSYEECRGPPRLFLLDKFDVAGAGACLKRYTDPSFFKVESASSGTATVEVHREKRIHKIKPKKGVQPRNGETPEVVRSHSKLHQLLLEERIENACSDPARLVKLKKKQLNGSAVEGKTGKSYMEKILEGPSPDHKMVCKQTSIPLLGKLTSDDTSESGIKILEISSITPTKRSLGDENTLSSPNEQELELNPYLEIDSETNGYLVQVHEQIYAGMTNEMSSNHLKVPDGTELVFDEQKKRECRFDGYHSDDVTSEVDDYMDALATMELELETDNECRPKKSLLSIQKIADSNCKGEHQLQAQFSDSLSFGDSSTSEEISSLEHDRNGEHNEVPAQLSDSQSTGTSKASDCLSSFRRDRNEHAQLQAQFSDNQSIGNSGSETEDMPSNQFPHTFELQKTYCGEFVMYDNAHVQGEMISDARPVLPGLGLMDSGHLLLSSDLGATSPMSKPTGTQSDETQSGPVELHLRLEDNDDRKCLVESGATRPAALSPVKDDASSVVSFDKNSSNNLEVCDPYFHSNAVLQVSNDSDFVHEGEYDDPSEIKVLQAESLNQSSSEILVGGDIGSHVGDPICPSTEVDLNSGAKLLFDGLKSEDDIVATHLNSEALSPVTETTLKSCFMEELCSDFTHRNLQDKPDLAEVKVLYPYQQSHFEEVPRIFPGDEISGSMCSLDLVEDDGHIKHPSSDFISSPMTSFTELEESRSIFAHPHKEMGVKKAVIRESMTELVTEMAVDQPEIASTDVQLNKNRSVPSDPSDSGIYNNIQDSSPKENIQYGSSINDMNVVPTCSVLDSQRSETIFVCQNNVQDGKDSLSPPSYNQPEPETNLHLFLKSQFSQQDAGFLFGNEESYTLEKFQSRHMQVSNQRDQERISQDVFEFAAEIHPYEQPSCDSSTKSSGQEINSTICVMDPFKPLPDLSLKVTNVRLEDMPPMPPLPPMQWRTSKVQLASLVTQREDIEVSEASFHPMQLNKPYNKSQFGISTSEKVTLLSQNPFLPIMAVENMHQHSYVFSDHPVAIPLQFPVMVNETHGQHNYLVLERSQIEDPILTLQDRPALGCVVASEGVLNSSPCPPILPAECTVSEAGPIFQQEKLTQSPSPLMEITGLEGKKDGPGELHLVLPTECPVSGDEPFSPKEKPIQSPSQLMEETGLEVKTLKQSSVNLEREQGDPSILPVSPIENVQPNPSLLPSEGEMAVSLYKSAQTSKFGTEISNGKPKNKLPFRQDPVIDPVAALDKSRLRKVTERVIPQRAPKGDERYSLLEQIRTKSFNLRPAVVKRPPSIQGPKTNLRVAAILEKANSIRQALAGSDEDDDADGWE